MTKPIRKQSQGTSNQDIIDITPTESREDTDVNQQEKRKEKSTQQKPGKKRKLAKLRNSELQLIPTPDISAETPAINVPTQKDAPKKEVTFEEPTDREVNQQMEKSGNTVLKFLRKIKMRLYVD